MDKTECLVKIHTASEDTMECPDDSAVLCDELCSLDSDINGARYHPVDDAYTLREHDSTLCLALPEYSCVCLSLWRKRICQCCDVRRMCMIDNTACAICCLHSGDMVHEMSRNLAGRLCTILKSPEDIITGTCIIDTNDSDILLRCERNIAHILSRACDREISSLKLRCAEIHVIMPSGIMKLILYCLDILVLHSVGKVSTIPFMPSLLESVKAHSYEIIKKHNKTP